MVPYTFLQDSRVTVLPTVDKSFEMTAGREKNGHTRTGPAAPSFEAVNVLPEITRHAVEYIRAHAAEAKAGKPFFVYLPLNAPHTPIAPSPEWQGKSGISPYADFVMQTDATLGAVLEALDQAGLRDDTLLVMTSDNGCSNQANLPELAKAGHNPNHVFRGHKADIFDGGHHIPFLARWPGHVAPNSTYKELACLNDWFATVADILKKPLPANAAEDSVSLLPALQGGGAPVRKRLIHHSVNGSFALRQDQWKLVLAQDSGGWTAPTPGSAAAKSLPAVQLYDLSKDIGEEHNLEAEKPELVAQLTRVLLGEIANGSTRSNH
jgi:arylsulfatase A-like enzyme